MAFESDLQGNSKEISTKEKCAGTKINESIYEEVRKLLDSAVSMAFLPRDCDFAVLEISLLLFLFLFKIHCFHI